MFKTRDIAVIGIYIALLVGAQFALSWVAGVEIVTLLLVAFCYYFGFKRSFILVNAFVAIRCLLYGFFPTVVLLWFVYYNIFAAVFAFVGARQKRKLTAVRHVYIVIIAVIMTALFTVLDNVVTPLFYGYNYDMTIAYIKLSLPVMLIQTSCTAVTVAVLFRRILKVFAIVYGSKEKNSVCSDPLPIYDMVEIDA